MKAVRFVVMGLAALAVIGCSTTKIRTDFDPRASFRELRTYRWVDQAVRTVRHPALNSPLVGARIQNAVDGQLAARGYRRVDADIPDFKIAYYIIADEKVDLYSEDRYYGYGGRYYHHGFPGPYIESTTYADPFLEGTLVLDVIDPASNEVIWRGWATKNLDEDPKPQEVDRYVKAAVKKILDRFPPTS